MDVFKSFIQKVADNILTPIVELLALAAFVIFVVGVVQYIRNAEDDAKRKEGRLHMFWGIVGLAILFSANALVRLVTHIAAGT